LTNDLGLKLQKHTTTFLNGGVLLQVIYKRKRREWKRIKKLVKIDTLPCGKGQGKPKQE
jgi:hypothetical protein